jgi:uncharacterized membrane protein YedE/YeeE
MHDFTPGSALLGGILIGLAASMLLVASGRVAGIAGILAGLVLPRRGDVAWRAWFLAGLLGAGLCAALLAPQRIGIAPRSVGMLAIAGLLVGMGTRLGEGCTSGHGVCGISRLSPRSIAATLAFMASGMLTVAVLRWLGVGS